MDFDYAAKTVNFKGTFNGIAAVSCTDHDTKSPLRGNNYRLCVDKSVTIHLVGTMTPFVPASRQMLVNPVQTILKMSLIANTPRQSVMAPL